MTTSSTVRLLVGPPAELITSTPRGTSAEHARALVHGRWRYPPNSRRLGSGAEGRHIVGRRLGRALSDRTARTRVAIALDHLEDIVRLDAKIDACTKQITAAVKASRSTVTRIDGIGPSTPP
jgi:hypothetical protein